MAGEHHSEPAPEITPAHLRQIIETEVEHLIDILDQLDPDPDLEDGGDGEPSIGAPEAQAGSWRGLWPEDNDDREADDADAEPELGSLEIINQCSWSKGEDGEPSLGSLNRFRQLCWSHGNNQELEDEHDGCEPCCEDEGAQCEDEGADCGEDGCCIRHSPGDSLVSWKAEQDHQRMTTMEAAKVTNDLRKVMLRHGLQPVGHLRVLGGAILKP